MTAPEWPADPAEGSVTEADHEAIVAAATDYIAAWLDNDAARMGSCLHEALVKRAVEPDGSIDEMSRQDMVLATTARPRQGNYVVTVLDAYGDLATVKVLSTDYVDHVQVARFGGRWQLLNVLWQPRVGT
ncbi:nuclear transport factor 2 family protein [Nocardioides jensenii]|uniref:nuclear transport factor 2 family protein n=1 Tax=Nocardioides jensenii TaxID=1843 RepID=UPI00147053E9|nr:nuclear transport factor 2 family protein [Nocardioides jensenii]